MENWTIWIAAYVYFVICVFAVEVNEDSTYSMYNRVASSLVIGVIWPFWIGIKLLFKLRHW